MVQQSFDQISSFLETLFFHLSARFYGHLILTMPNVMRLKDTDETTNSVDPDPLVAIHSFTFKMAESP